MATLTLNYSDIKAAYNASDKAAKKCESYANEISKKITKKIDDLERGSSAQTSYAKSYAKKKISELNRQAGVYSSYATRLDDFLNGSSGAKSIDKKVSDYIKADSKTFREKHNMKTNAVTEFFTWLSTTILNKTDFGKWLKNAFTSIKNWLHDVGDALEYWYRCGGGKFVLKIVGGIILLVVAVVALIVAWPIMVGAFSALAAGFTMAAAWTALVATATFVGAIIGVVNAVVDTTFNVKALQTNGSDPAWAKRYDSYSSASEYLNKNRFGNNKWLNKNSYSWATAIEVTELTCALINIADMAKNGINFLRDPNARQKFFPKRDTTTFKKVSFTRYNKVTFGSIKNGLGAIKTNIAQVIANPSIEAIKKGLLRKNSIKPLADIYKWSNSANKALKPIKTGAKFFDSWNSKDFNFSGFVDSTKKYIQSKTVIYKELESLTKKTKAVFN